MASWRNKQPFFVMEILEMMNSLSLAFEPMIVVDEFRRIEQSLLSWSVKKLKFNLSFLITANVHAKSQVRLSPIQLVMTMMTVPS
jgi:hypothetical protein